VSWGWYSRKNLPYTEQAGGRWWVRVCQTEGKPGMIDWRRNFLVLLAR